jgi:hypothetical protein
MCLVAKDMALPPDETDGWLKLLCNRRNDLLPLLRRARVPGFECPNGVYRFLLLRARFAPFAAALLPLWTAMARAPPTSGH